MSLNPTSYRYHRLIAMLFLFITACGTTERTIDERPLELAPLSIKTLIDKNRKNSSKIQYLRASVTLNLESPQSAMQVKSHFAVRYPDSIFVKMEGFLGIDALVASINRQTFMVYNIVNQQVVKGPTTAEGIKKVFDYQVNFEELLDVLTGLVFLNENDLSQAMDSATDKGYYRLSIKEGEGIKKIWLDPLADFAVTRIEHYQANGELVLIKEFSRFHRQQGMFHPKYVRIFRPKENDLLSLYFEERILNKPFSSQLFVIHYPKQAEIIDVSNIK